MDEYGERETAGAPFVLKPFGKIKSSTDYARMTLHGWGNKVVVVCVCLCVCVCACVLGRGGGRSGGGVSSPRDPDTSVVLFATQIFLRRGSTHCILWWIHGTKLNQVVDLGSEHFCTWFAWLRPASNVTQPSLSVCLSVEKRGKAESNNKLVGCRQYFQRLEKTAFRLCGEFRASWFWNVGSPIRTPNPGQEALCA